MKTKLYKIKEGKLDTWLNWGSFLMENYKKEILHRELISDTFSVFTIKNEHYTTIGVAKESRLTDKEITFNQKHFTMIEKCLVNAKENF